MRRISLALIILCLALFGASTALANCADDAIDTCNEKHPDPNKSDGAYGAYELCIKAQLGQKCPNSQSGNQGILTQVQRARKGVAPKCPAGFALRVDWNGKADRCIQSTPLKFRTVPVRAAPGKTDSR